MRSSRNLWITAGAFLVLGVVAAAVGQVATAAEMDAIDAAGPGGPAGTWLSLGGVATIVGFLLNAVGIIVLAIGIARATRTKDAASQAG